MAAETEPGRPPKILAEDRQVTRLGESVFRTGQISKEAQDLACDTLRRMTNAYLSLDVVAARIVATAAVRDASNQEQFLERVAEIAGQPAEIISGQEEARLIHLGLESRWPHPNQRILIIDIGGGSAEYILAEHGRLTAAFSRPLGAVRLKEVFLATDPPTAEQLKRLDEYIEEKITPALKRIGQGPFDRVIGTSASASALVCAANRIPRGRRDEGDRQRVTATQLRQLYAKLSTMNLDDRRKLAGIGPRRAEIIVPGAAVLLRSLEWFKAPALYYSAAGVRDGIIIDLAQRGVGREQSQLTREQRQVVEAFARRFAVDMNHARRVAEFSHKLFESLYPLHRLPRAQGRYLEAAAYLRDVGHFISDTSHHKHSWYIVANSDLPGFTDSEKGLVARLCRYHRKAMPAARHPEYQLMDPESKRTLLLLTPILRIADALDRSREQRIEALSCEVEDGVARLTLRSDRDISLEQWAVERAGEEFRQVYGRSLEVLKGAAVARA